MLGPGNYLYQWSYMMPINIIGTVGLLCASWAAMQKPSNLIVIGVDRINEEKAKLSGATHCIHARNQSRVGFDIQILLQMITR